MTGNGLEAVHLSKSYTIDSRQITVLDDVSIKAHAGEFLVIEGKSGSGKSTLLSLLSGLDKPDNGRVVLAGTDITGLSEDALAPFRNRTMGYVFQSFHLVPSLTALENIMFPAELNGDGRAAAKALELLRRVDLEHRKNNFPHQLSGGEKQRVAICRALVNRPLIVFADEPTGNLDSVNGDIILQLLLELRREFNTTLVMATHSREIGAGADHVVRLRDGRIQTPSAGHPDR
ncbi:MAG: ABC transporter ATP-binding protein [Desulfobulbaceae bacterium]|jgi:putative ABC transport system ATP-binding protein|nr:ABC transporter ATP-binding protein [Desulfobulbaceae bacterium]MDY0351870.1 ABC transporter ATP-binding protein [Desulfobulbaceae bacterium]